MRVIWALLSYTSFDVCVVKGLQTIQSNQRTLAPRRAFATNAVEPIVEEVVKNVNSQEEEISENVFKFIAELAGSCLLESDLRRDAIGKASGTQASSATNWISDAAAFTLKQGLGRVRLKLPQESGGVERDEALSWMRWMKATPKATIVDVSDAFCEAVNCTISDRTLHLVNQLRTDVLSRLVCRLILLPSGMELQSPLIEPTASIIYGKLLFGGVTRYRRLASSNGRSPPRRAGVRTETKIDPDDPGAVWIMYGGPARMYESVDIGSCAILEVAILPRGKTLDATCGRNMCVRNAPWNPYDKFAFHVPDESGSNGSEVATLSPSGDILSRHASGAERNRAYTQELQSSVGGLRPQIQAIVRRVLDGRVVRSIDQMETASEDVRGGSANVQTSSMFLEARELSVLGLTPVRGLLLYGPPGCGKTALARELSRSLKAREPKIVAAPELLDRWVGGSEKQVRELFADAEAELAVCNGDATKSALHVIVIDEIDAVFRKRSLAEDSGEATRSSVVNQILAKLDGVNAIPNVLLIGMTNRPELLDEALLRPGRLEVQIEIPLPDQEGRREILKIHFAALRRGGRLSFPLCCAIDGVPVSPGEAKAVGEWRRTGESGSRASEMAAPRRKRDEIFLFFQQIQSRVRPVYDLAADYATKGFSGADIAGLVRCAGSIALSRARDEGSGVGGLLISLDDVKQALDEVKR